MDTRDTRSLPSEAQEAQRIKAVKAVLGGMTHVSVAEVFGVTRHSVDEWMKHYRAGGWSALKAKRRGRPKGRKLLPWQQAQIARSVADRCPDQLKMHFALWTREAVAELIWRRFQVEVSVTTVGRYLHSWGMTPQKPLRRAYEQDPIAVQRWLEEEYPWIRALAKRDKARIYWGDETGFRSDHTAGRTWGRKGQTPVVAGTGQRFSGNLISAITNQGALCFKVFTGRFTNPVFIEFCRRLIRHAAGQKVVLIVDRHPVHRSRDVRNWLAEHTEEIEMFFLPGYSPQLNPDEVLNQDVKSNAVGRRRPGTLREMVSNVRSFLWKRQRQPSVVRNYFQEPNVAYAAN